MRLPEETDLPPRISYCADDRCHLRNFGIFYCL